MEEVTNNKYNEAIALYNVENIDNEKINTIIDECKERIEREEKADTIKKLITMLDLTSLNASDNEESILSLIENLNRVDDELPQIPPVASICVYPNYISLVRDSLEVEGVKCCCVAGGFPSAQTFSEVKIAEVALALHEGADEIDIVQNCGKVLNGDYEGLCTETEEIRDICKDKTLKIIIETGALKSLKNVKIASILAIYSGADFIKTSTGKECEGATPESFVVMCQTIKEYYQKSKRKIGIKVAGGIRTINDATLYYTIVEKILGKEWLNSSLFRIGASSLYKQLVERVNDLG